MELEMELEVLQSKKLFIATPVYEGALRTSYVWSMLQLMGFEIGRAHV